ncbi:MAG: DUF421 domain-containing protein [Firmicutes bacterium]|nr:DUF421 domain-containing protein [Bacillota bacterium]
MVIIIARTFVLYFAVLFSLRIMGKGELSKMDPFQMVILFMISELASLPIAEPDVSLIHGVCAIITLMFLQILLSIFALRFPTFCRLVNGTPTLLIDKGTLNKKELQRLRISVEDLTQQLRLKGYPSITDIDYAVMEINGDLSVIPNPSRQPLTPSDVDLTAEEGYLPVVLVANGILYHQNLPHAGITERQLKQHLMKLGYPRYDQIYMAATDQHRSLVVYPKTSPERITLPKGGDPTCAP